MRCYLHALSTYLFKISWRCVLRYCDPNSGTNRFDKYLRCIIIPRFILTNPIFPFVAIDRVGEAGANTKQAKFEVHSER